jgi:hypothetical protein
MPLTQTHFDSFWNDVVRRHFSDAKIKYKDESLFMRIIGALMFFCPSFMTKFVTVLGNTIWLPSRGWIEHYPKRALFVFAHEFVHMWDHNIVQTLRRFDTFTLGYASLQIWALTAILAFLGFITSWFLLFLIPIVLLAPWPSPWRANVEANGYAMTMYMRRLIDNPGYNAEEGADLLAGKHFASKQYYWMCWSKSRAKKMLLSRYETLPNTHGAFVEVQQWVKTQLR